MVSFVCDGCGKCCRSLGRYITIERQLNSRDYYCRNGMTREIFPVHVAAEFADAIDETFTDGPTGSEAGHEYNGRCIFQQPEPRGKGFVCAIYETRPRVCRDFRCYRLIIFDKSGTEAGRGVGRADIRTADPVLALIWNNEIRGIIENTQPDSDTTLLQKILAILASHGYRGEPVS
jgi:hypothetical protein